MTVLSEAPFKVTFLSDQPDQGEVYLITHFKKDLLNFEVLNICWFGSLQ